MSRVSRQTKLRLADVLVKTVGALLPGPAGTLAGELGAWALEARAGVDPEKELAIEIEEAVGGLTKKAARSLERSFPDNDVDRATELVVATFESVELDPGSLADLGLSAQRLTGIYLAAAPADLEEQLGDAAGAYRRLVAEICYRLERLFLGNTYVQGRILQDILERRRGEEVRLFKRKTEWDDDEFTWDYRFEARELMPAVAATSPSGAELELAIDAVFQEPHGQVGGEPGHAFDLIKTGRGWIVRGAAGAGKTFLLHYLALQALAGGLPIEQWRAKVPLYFDLSGGVEPVPADALARLDGRLASRAPAGWEERLIQRGEMLVLLDNVDPADKDKKVARLIGDAMAAGCVVIVNSRSAVPASWIDELGLREIHLLELSPLEVDRFVMRWHEAVAEECATQQERDEVRAARDELLMAIGRCSDIRRLCAGPNFLAGLCRALLRSDLTLPADRAILVQQVLEAAGDDPVPLDDWDDLIELAHWSAENDEEFTPAQAATWLGRTPARIDELVQRHRMLRRCDGAKLAFVRDAVRETLAARFRAQRQFVGQLAEAAAVPAKRGAVVAAAAFLPQSAADELLGRLVDHGRTDVARAALHVMQQVDADLRASILAATADLFPPVSPEQVGRVVAGGGSLLDLLAHQEPAGAGTAAAVLALTGPEDLAVVATVAARADAAARQLILEAWDDHPDKAALDEMMANREERS
ncbi:NACHT domain-containing protein [Actinoplanes sp. CA-142083]|uniref:NACHT domain-containing protein n=1 Tax=Actinoplanes sp. CA-142083 TaxID=3239903 RepID=UPI003D8F73FE